MYSHLGAAQPAHPDCSEQSIVGKSPANGISRFLLTEHSLSRRKTFFATSDKADPVTVFLIVLLIFAPSTPWICKLSTSSARDNCCLATGATVYTSQCTDSSSPFGYHHRWVAVSIASEVEHNEMPSSHCAQPQTRHRIRQSYPWAPCSLCLGLFMASHGLQQQLKFARRSWPKLNQHGQKGFKVHRKKVIKNLYKSMTTGQMRVYVLLGQRQFL